MSLISFITCFKIGCKEQSEFQRAAYGALIPDAEPTHKTNKGPNERINEPMIQEYDTNHRYVQDYIPANEVMNSNYDSNSPYSAIPGFDSNI